MSEETWRWMQVWPGVWVPATVVEAEAKAEAEVEVERFVFDAAELPY